MLFPTASEYMDALENCSESMSKLRSLVPERDRYGKIFRSNGGLAVVFKMRDQTTGRIYALKCFHKTIPDIAKSYRSISRFLDEVRSDYVVKYRFLESEIWVSTSQTEETLFPVMLMDWVDGVTLREAVRQAAENEDCSQLRRIAHRFDEMSLWLLDQDFAHTDLKAENIIMTKGGELVLVDYDGMFVPEMDGQEAREEGTPGYRHPNRTSRFYNRHSDDFSILIISLGLRLLAMDPCLYKESKSEEHLLFTENDLKDLYNSRLWEFIIEKTNECDPGINNLIAILQIALGFPEEKELVLLKDAISINHIYLSKELNERRFELKTPLNGHKDPIYDIAFSYDSKFLATIGEETIKVLAAPTFSTLVELSCKPNSIKFVRYSPDGRYLAYSAPAGEVHIWDYLKSMTWILATGFTAVYDCCFSPSGKHIVCCGDSDFFATYETGDWRRSVTPIGIIDRAYLLCFSQEEGRLATASRSKEIYLYGFSGFPEGQDEGRPKLIIREHFWITQIKYSQDGRYLVVALEDGRIKAYDTQNGYTLHSEILQGKDCGQSIFTIFSDGRHLLSCGNAHAMYLYEFPSLHLLEYIDTPNDYNHIVVSSPNGSYVACGQSTKDLNVYSISTEGVAPFRKAEWFDTKTKRRDWWDGLEQEWRNAFRESVICIDERDEPNDEDLIGLINSEELFLRGPNSEEESDISFLLTNLSGIENLTKLRRLSCNGNSIQDLSPLSHLPNLKYLSCGHNGIESLEPLSNCLFLQELRCHNNRISSLLPLQHAHKLKMLDISHTKVSSLNPIGHILFQISEYNFLNSLLDEMDFHAHSIEPRRTKDGGDMKN
jgi:WD40 repeat protein